MQGQPDDPSDREASGSSGQGTGRAEIAVDRHFLGDPRALDVPPVESPFLEALLAEAQVSDEIKDHARFYNEHGYVVLEDVFEPGLIDAIADKYDWLFDAGTTFAGASGGVQALLAMDPSRKQDAWWVCDAIGQLACHPRILELLQLFYGRRPIPFQTLNFLYGTEQPAHSDSIHFSSIPARYMCGVWVALEDMTDENGPLLYYPGSHKFPEVQLDWFGLWGHEGNTAIGPTYTLYENFLRSLVKAQGLREERLTVKKGTALIWSANLLHGGSAITRRGATRMSQVTHYYFEDCVYYAPIHSNVSLGEYRLKTIHDLRTQAILPHTLNGEPVVALPVGNGNHRLSRPGSSDSALAERPLSADDPAELLSRARQLEVERNDLRRRIDELQVQLGSGHAEAINKALSTMKGLLGTRKKG